MVLVIVLLLTLVVTLLVINGFETSVLGLKMTGNYVDHLTAFERAASALADAKQALINGRGASTGGSKQQHYQVKAYRGTACQAKHSVCYSVAATGIAAAAHVYLQADYRVAAAKVVRFHWQQTHGVNSNGSIKK